MRVAAPINLPGIYLARVDSCVADEDQLGRYIDLRLQHARTGRFLCYDVLRFTPRATRIALTKLVELGVRPVTPRLDTDTLVGRCVWIALHEEEFERVVRPKVDIRRLNCGFLREDAAPAGSCECCGGGCWWRRKRSGLWICSQCCPPPAPADEIDEVRGE